MPTVKIGKERDTHYYTKEELVVLNQSPELSNSPYGGFAANDGKGVVGLSVDFSGDQRRAVIDFVANTIGLPITRIP